MINAIIIDDEFHSRDTLSILLKNYCPEVTVTATYASAKDALEALKYFTPDLVFLDIEMPVMNGFQFLEQLPSIPFAIIFTTSYDQYAIKAIKFSALDFLLKPVDPDELQEAVKKVEQRKLPLAEQFQMLMNHFHQKKDEFKKIALSSAEGFDLISAEDLIRCEAKDNYTYFYLKGKRTILVSRTLKDVEEQLAPFNIFIRVHHSSLINLNEITKYTKGEGGLITMSDGSLVNVSRRKKDELMALIRQTG
jgi:two-component system, LytTR family, response regulator